MTKALMVLCAAMILSASAQAQEFRFGFNLFPVNTYQLKYDKEYYILPDYTSIKLDQSMRVSARKSYLAGAYFRFNWHHVMLKTEFNYFNRYFSLGQTGFPQYQSNDPYDVTIRYLTFEVPLYVGYTLKPNNKFKVTPFVGVSAELGKLKPLIPPVMKVFEDMETERVYRNLWDQSAIMPSTLINYAAGVEFMYYGVSCQIAAKRNATEVFYHNPDNANLTELTMIECTIGFGLHKGGFAHTMMRRWK